MEEFMETHRGSEKPQNKSILSPKPEGKRNQLSKGGKIGPKAMNIKSDHHHISGQGRGH